jgi:hypothetical protein
MDLRIQIRIRIHTMSWIRNTAFKDVIKNQTENYILLKILVFTFRKTLLKMLLDHPKKNLGGVGASDGSSCRKSSYRIIFIADDVFLISRSGRNIKILTIFSKIQRNLEKSFNILVILKIYYLFDNIFFSMVTKISR